MSIIIRMSKSGERGEGGKMVNMSEGFIDFFDEKGDFRQGEGGEGQMNI